MPTVPSPKSRRSADADADVAQVDLSVVIVNYNVREFLEQALRSLDRARGGLSVEVFVVDNNSVDGSVEMVRGCFPHVRLIANEANVGFSRANNQAIREARGRYLFVLNPDTIVQEDTLERLVAFMDAHPEAGAVGCRILNPDGSFAPESRRAFPTPRVAFYRIVGLSRLFPKSPTFGRYNLTYLPQDEVVEVDALSGSCMLVRHAALYRRRADSRPFDAADPERDPATGAGLLDEHFFMYGEDLDWCYRIQQAGWKIYYTPETQIIHYKGESTKKGELRYVRLFYGAMLRFTEKHFQSRYSRIFAALLRLGILTRAGLTVLGNAARRAAPMLLDAALVFATVTVVAAFRSAHVAPLFYASVAPAYAFGTVFGTAAAGGYTRRGLQRVRPVLVGALFGLVAVAALSFFIKTIAFSRAVVLLSFPLIVLVLSGLRLARRLRKGSLHAPRRAVFVGPAAEAQRLADMLASHLKPPFELVGYVAPKKGQRHAPQLVRLGTLRQLRDLVRLRRIDDVVFAGEGLPNHVIFGLMQQLRDLPVQFRILAEGREHVIGKASVEDLSLPALVEAQDALGTFRSPAARRAFEIPLAVLGLALHPALALAGRWAGADSFPGRLARRTRRLTSVLSGRRALIGYDEGEPLALPRVWGLKPGVFALTDALDAPRPSEAQRRRACWLYTQNQSARLDLDILLKVLKNLR